MFQFRCVPSVPACSRCGHFLLYVLILLSSILTPLCAQSVLLPYGYLTGSARYTPEADENPSSLALRGALNWDIPFGPESLSGEFHFSGEFFAEGAGLVSELHQDYSGEILYPLAYSWIGKENSRIDLDVKEAFVSFAVSDFDIVAGKQILTWGLADGSNPTDVINPRYIGTRAVSTSAEKKMGSVMLNTVWNIPSGYGTVQAVFIPVPSFNQLPSMGSFIGIDEPGFAPENMEGGIRGLFYAGQLSFSLSALSLLDRYPSDVVAWKHVQVSPFPPPAGVWVDMPSRLGHNRQTMLGLDTAIFVKGFDVRSEWACFVTEDTEGTDPYARNPWITGVFQLSRSLFNDTTSVSFSWAPQYIFNFEDPVVSSTAPQMARLWVGQGFEFEQMLALRVQRKFLGETLQSEVMMLTAVAARDWFVAPSVTYNIADGWNLKAVMNFYGSFREEKDLERQLGTFGNDSTIDTDSIGIEVRYDF